MREGGGEDEGERKMFYEEEGKEEKEGEEEEVEETKLNPVNDNNR